MTMTTTRVQLNGLNVSVGEDDITGKLCHNGLSSTGTASSTLVAKEGSVFMSIGFGGPIAGDGSIRWITPQGEVYEGIINITGETNMIKIS
jgi:hypothetical protein